MRMVEVYGNVKDGRLKIAYRDRFLAAVKQLPDCIVRLLPCVHSGTVRDICPIA